MKNKFTKTTIKRILILALVLVITVGANSMVFASNSNVERDVLIGVSPVNPTEDLIKGTGAPSQVWDVAANGTYYFAAKSNYQDMYTNYKFIGKSSYAISVTNNGDYALEVTVKSFFTVYKRETVQAGQTVIFVAEGMSAADDFYIRFVGSYQNFEGWIN